MPKSYYRSIERDAVESKQRELSDASQFVGKVAPAHTVELGFEIDGTLQQLPLPEGALVQAGDVIAQLDPERFELALESARADHELAEKTLSRVESLKASGTVSQAELDEAVARAKLTGSLSAGRPAPRPPAPARGGGGRGGRGRGVGGR